MITQETNALIKRHSSYYKTRILDGKGEKHSIYKPEVILHKSCLAYGATFAGRKAAAENILKSKIKLPIPVIPQQGVYMFPTSALKSPHCTWLSYYQIRYFEARDNRTYVEFHDGTHLFVNVSVRALDKQYKRTSQVIAVLNRSLFFGHN
ncbi:MAG TPA: competence protein ComK [Bacillota bacterium]|nr:competence protein ComK [Bacillota bacterium]